MISRNSAFLGQVALRPERAPGAALGQFDMPPDCNYWAEEMKKAARDIADSQRSIQARAASPYRTDFVNDPYTQMKFEEARKRYDNAKRSYDSCVKWEATYWSGTPIQQPVTTPMTTPQGTPQLQPPIETPPQPIEDIGPMDVPSFDPRSLLPPTETPYINPHTIEPEEATTQEEELPGFAQAQGLPCPEGQHRPPEGGWCVPDAPPVATGYSPANALQRFGGYGGIINMGPSSAVPFTMGFRKEEDMSNEPFLGQIPISPEAQCPPGKVLYNVAGSLLCVDAGVFPPADYSGARPIGAFGGFGMAPSAPFGTAGMGPSSVPVTMGRRAMLGQVRLARRPY